VGEAGQNSLGNAPAPGSRVGPYTIDASIGSGGVASVYRAHDAAGHVVALKILHPSRIVDEDKKRFTREYKALQRMDHPNVVKVFEAGVDNGYPWLAMEFVDGEDLGSLIARWEAGKMGDRFELVERILRDLCGGLQYIHERGLVHRDLKPSNVLVRHDGVAKITDFGVVKDSTSSTTNLTMAGRLVGTVAFMAPEQITGEKLDARADLYALGAVLYNMLTFKRPIEASSVAGYLARHLTEVPKAPAEVDPAVPQRLERVCQRLLLKEPSQRYQTATAVLEALDREDPASGQPLRGREDAIGEWTRRIGTLGQGGGGCLAVIGDVGSGRSHLLRCLLELADNHGFATATASGEAADVLDALARGLGGTSTSPDPAERLAAAVRGRTVVIAVDDLDRAGALAINGLAKTVRQLVANEGEPLLLVFTAISATGAVAGLADGGATGLPPEVLTIGEVDRRAVTALLRDRGIAGSLAPVLARRLHDDFEGRVGPMIEQLDAVIEAGWIERAGDLMRPTRPVDDFRKLALPVPKGIRVVWQLRLVELEDDARDLLEALAVLDRPSSAVLLAGCVSSPIGDSDAARTLEGLVRDGVLKKRSEEDADVVFLFAHPAVGQIVRDGLSEASKRQRHAAIAAALSKRRRREASLEVAQHLLDAGDPHQAYPMLVQAGRAAARSGRTAEVFDIVSRARAIQAECETRLDRKEAAKLRRWLYLLEGEARLGRGEWTEAIEPLEAAVVAARIDNDAAALARCLGSLGRAWYRQGKHDKAKPLLEEALKDIDPGAPERASATRALADILLRSGDLAAAERLWDESLSIAKQVASKDGEARARRGLAHVRVLQGRYDEAARLLDAAEDMLQSGGDARVRAGVLARSIELDLVGGRYGSALRRCETLLELATEKELPERLPEVWALLADVRSALGQTDGAVDACRHALTFAKANPDGLSRIRAARVLGIAGLAREGLAALPTPEELGTNPIDDPAGQLASVRARLLVGEASDTARDLATWVAVRPPAALAIRAARIAIDATMALAAVGDPDLARSTAKRAIKSLQTTGSSQTSAGGPTDGFVLEALLALYATSPDDRVHAAAGQVAERIAAGLPGGLGTSFRARADVAKALAKR
jgi:tetratricopeptide (TPR) repeat protein